MTPRAVGPAAIAMATAIALSGCVTLLDDKEDPPFRELFAAKGDSDHCFGAGQSEVSRSFASEPENELRLTYRLGADTGTARITIDARDDSRDANEIARATNGETKGVRTAATASSGGWVLRVDCPDAPALGVAWDILVEGRDGGFRFPAPDSPGLPP